MVCISENNIFERFPGKKRLKLKIEFSSQPWLNEYPHSPSGLINQVSYGISLFLFSPTCSLYCCVHILDSKSESKYKENHRLQTMPSSWNYLQLEPSCQERNPVSRRSWHFLFANVGHSHLPVCGQSLHLFLKRKLFAQD